MSAPSDDDLLGAVGAGDRQAFAVLMGRHTRAMLSLSQRITGNAIEADDIVQEAFMKVWLHAPHWQPDGAARFSTWLYRVVLNASIDRRRRPAFTAVDTLDEPVDTAPDGLQQAVRRQRAGLIRVALKDLPARQREALALHYFTGLSGPEAARVLEVSVASVEALLVRGKRALLAALRRRGVGQLGDLL
jgi:RNA polymerase sigma-70 factor (ECF subfamily)